MEKSQNYPGVLERMKAAFADSIVIIIFMVITTNIFSAMENVSDQMRIIAFVFIFWLYDPLFTSIAGGTIGHLIVGLRVKRLRHPDQNIFILLAIVRSLIKYSLGIISLLVIGTNDKKRAIHDMITNSIVVYK